MGWPVMSVPAKVSLGLNERLYWKGCYIGVRVERFDHVYWLFYKNTFYLMF
jgi:hypothetical protein